MPRLQDSTSAIPSFASLITFLSFFPQNYLKLHHHSCKDTKSEVFSASLIDSFSVPPIYKAKMTTRRTNFSYVTGTCDWASEPVSHLYAHSPQHPLQIQIQLQWIWDAWSIPDADIMEHLKCHCNWTETYWWSGWGCLVHSGMSGRQNGTIWK